MEELSRLVVKIGSSSLVKDGSVNKRFLAELARDISTLKERGIDVCLVTSGAIATGVGKLGLEGKPNDIEGKQACAAIGQSYVIRQYEEVFDIYGLKCAQLLLTHDDFSRPSSSLHLKNTFNALFRYGVIPIVNENDATAVDEIKVGDNDTLGALTALLVEANAYVIVSDVEGLYTSNPRDGDAELISEVDEITESVKALATGHGVLGTGGMATKLKAGELVTEKGLDMYIIHNSKIERLCALLLNGERVGTKFRAK